jgi:hypothetical protein
MAEVRDERAVTVWRKPRGAPEEEYNRGHDRQGPEREGPRPTIDRPHPGDDLFARVPPPLAEALGAYLESLRPKPTTTAVVIAALEDFLEDKGFWPFSRQDDN